MIKRIVIWTLKPEEREASVAEMKRLMEAMRGSVEGLMHLEVGVNELDEAGAGDVVLYAEFANQAALDVYQDHPDHLRLKAYVGPRRLSRVVVSYEA
ncbi:Dabb family protein [Pseudomonas putida]|nr:Dabb family protein [Pseudomonas putida]